MKWESTSKTGQSPGISGPPRPSAGSITGGPGAGPGCRISVRNVKNPMMATSWPPSTIRVTSIAGRQVTSPSRTTNAPTGRAPTPKPAPEPESVFSPSAVLSPPPPPPPPPIAAAGMIRTPSRSIGSP